MSRDRVKNSRLAAIAPMIFFNSLLKVKITKKLGETANFAQRFEKL
jgi:hypothetical protein